MQDRELIINFMDLPVCTSTIVALLNDLCAIKDKDVEVKVERRYSHKQGVSYHITDDLANWLDEFLDNECPVKNGCQIYKDTDSNMVYFCLTDCNYYDDNNNLKGTDETRLYFRNHFTW